MLKRLKILGSRCTALAVCALALAACGQKGSLFLAPPAGSASAPQVSTPPAAPASQ
ncbi:lipoprotein [Methylibium sp.]|uniref:LPS translocon maturation chaperone LptM n=1 Tax=Methylibium sp. TaxID=2067992 RepID=UPI0025FB6A51|nr:lipoprotein [Methylibium sp.]